MLSILIPIYNFDVRPFISELHSQATALNVPFEIRCYDDCSFFEYRIMNQKLGAISKVVYRELPQNLGRSAIRNKLASDARYENLLFLDCDGQCENDSFLSAYAPFFDSGKIVCGGRSYSPEPPSDPDFYLHWYYGTEREVNSAEERSRQPYSGFQTNNFLVGRELFTSTGLNEELKGYGHEDTLFGMVLAAKRAPLEHISNPLRHIGLEKKENFLDKTRQGISNLLRLLQHGDAGKHVKIIRAYKAIRRLRLTTIVMKKLSSQEEELTKNVLSDRPLLHNLDKLKLLWLLRGADQTVRLSGSAR